MIKIENLMNSGYNELNKIRKDILSGFNLALNSIDPYNSILNSVSIKNSKLFINEFEYNLEDFNNIRIIAFGKASIKMSEAISSMINITEGVVVGVNDNIKTTDKIKYIKGGHPIPDEKSFLAGKEILQIADRTASNDLTFILISGGGSALVEDSIINIEKMQKLTNELIRNGANIDELNTVRKHLSNIKGGRILKRMKGVVISLIISDVVGDALDVIASGPTFYDSSTFLDAYNILEKYNLLNFFDDVTEIIKKGIQGKIDETLKANEMLKVKFQNFLVASNNNALKTLKNFFSKSGYSILFLGSEIEGNVFEVAKVISAIGKSVFNGNLKIKKPCAIIFGGETTVIVRGNGIGGRNSELVLYITKFMENIDFVFSSIGTDGIDGVSPACGAISDSETLKRVKELKLDIDDYLKRNDSYSFFNKLNDSIVTGPTGTNVADIGVLIIT